MNIAGAMIIAKITWNNPADKLYGHMLTIGDLNANASNSATGAPLNGYFEYDPPLGTYLGAGQNQPLSAT